MKYLYGAKLGLTAPVDLMLELSSACNQSCTYCYHASENLLPFEKGLMPLNLAMGLLEQGRTYGVNSVKFNFRGEPTLHPHFGQITQRAAELAGGSVYLDRIVNSNFKFNNNRDDIFQGFCSLTKVKVSFDSFRKKIFETQRAGAKYELALMNIDKLYNYPGRDNELVIQAVRTQLNKDEDLEGEIRRRWPSAVPSIRDVVSGRKSSEIGDMELRRRDFKNRQPCRQAFVRLIVNWDGKVTPCCPDIASKLIIGDATRETLIRIFNSPAAMRLRQDLKSGKAFEQNPCLNCPSFESYKGYKAPWKS